MFFVLSKILAFFVMPITWVIGCFLLSKLSKNTLWRKRFFWLGIVLLILFSNQYLANRAMLLWEKEPVPIATLPDYDTGIVFTGVTKPDKSPKDRVYFEKGADRITHALQLYKQGKIKHVLISGGTSLTQKSDEASAVRLKDFLMMAGVPDSVITVEPRAVNTYENAVFTAEILKKDFPGQNYLLITSSFHMRRAALCLKKQGITFKQFPTDFYTGHDFMSFDNLFIPKAGAFLMWEKIIKELSGIVVYRLMGYL